jgi:predicted GH43/DUF377 family glycosyl hydrolase
VSWKRLGVVYQPDGGKPWARSHAALPIPLQTGADEFRFFFSSRDGENRSHVGWADVDLSGPPRVLRVATEPALIPGEDGTFDDSGIGIGCLVPSDQGLRLYYMGWNLGQRSAWHNAIGLARAAPSRDRFERYSAGPILDRSPEDPYSISYPCVLQRAPQDWLMWYGSNLSADVSSTGMKHAIKLARSRDGIHWERDGATVIGFNTPDEHAIARPTVATIGDALLMCFACRGQRYRIGAALSKDGISWQRIDALAGLVPSSSGWDSEMTCYPSLFHYGGRLWLAYNGNSFGATGFGLAIWEGADPAAGM